MNIAPERKIDIGTHEGLVASVTERAVSTFAKPCLIIGLVSAVAISVMAQSVPVACVALGFFVAQAVAFAVATSIRGTSGDD